MSPLFPAAAGCLLPWVCAWAAVAEPRAGDVVFQTDFEGTNEVRTWGADHNRNVRVADGFQSGHSLQVEAPTGGASNTAVRVTLPVEQLRGARVKCVAMIKADGVTAPPHPWNGVKFMLHVSGPEGELWQQQDKVAGTFDWRRVLFQARVPEEATAAELVLGLEAVNGRAQFDDVKITVVRGSRVRPAAAPVGPVFTGRDEPRLRGAMIHPDLTPESLRLLGQEWNANLIRWQLVRTGAAARIQTPAEYDAWLEGQLRQLDAALPLCEQYGVRVVLDLHSPPGGTPTTGGYAGSDTGLFTNKATQSQFIEVWQLMARRYRESHALWGYDLANDPVEGEVGEGCDDWQALATRTARAVRQIDARHAIIIEPAPWGGPEALANLDPVPVPGVVYSVHMYQPHPFTHQGVNGSAVGLRYPGVIAGKPWDKDQIRRALKPVVDWQRDYGVHIYIGEFSAIRWAPDDSARRYLSDCIDVFEENGWDWSYHAFREWDGWSVEHGADPKDHARSVTPTTREKLLREWFAKNVKAK